MLRDLHTKQHRKVGVLALSINHPEHARPRWLVVARISQGREPWYLLSSERTETEQEAWEVVLAYTKRWKIERCWRFHKSALAIESVRI